MMENINSSQNESRKRARGPTTCKKLKAKTFNKAVEKTIEFGENANPNGTWKNGFTSYVGAVARQRIDINIQSWKEVTDGLKDTFWQDIKV